MSNTRLKNRSLRLLSGLIAFAPRGRAFAGRADALTDVVGREILRTHQTFTRLTNFRAVGRRLLGIRFRTFGHFLESGINQVHRTHTLLNDVLS